MTRFVRMKASCFLFNAADVANYIVLSYNLAFLSLGSAVHYMACNVGEGSDCSDHELTQISQWTLKEGSSSRFGEQ